MSRKLWTGFALALVGMLVGFGAATVMADDSKDHAELAKKWEAAYNGGDAAAVAALYTEDGMMMPPNAAAASGRKAIEAAVKADMAAIPGKLVIETVEHGTNGNLGYARGTFSVVDAEGNTVDTGKWLDVRKKVGGKWLVHRDIWNSDTPLAE